MSSSIPTAAVGDASAVRPTLVPFGDQARSLQRFLYPGVAQADRGASSSRSFS